ncbi:MAG: pheT [Acidobacteria bacterium]|nr:pheT [Acidobacteriota bacterium]
MKLLVSWLRDFVDARVGAAELASLLSMRGFEVASIDAVGPDDAVVDFEITANRPDCLSVRGLAREAATALRLPFRDPAAGEAAGTISSPDLSVFIDDADLCPRYAAAVVEVKVGPSPEWMQARLTAAGVRPINNVVDVTNYVLLELGQPLHAFDLERLGGRQLRARPARAGERIRTLDGEDRELAPGMLVIADASVPQAVAGVMGGAATEVWSGTRLVALESACFKPASVRRTGKKLGLGTEASQRFERGADIGVPVAALERACALLEQIGAGSRRGGVLDCYPEPRARAAVGLRRGRIAGLLGAPVPDEEVEAILAGLGFEASRTGDGWLAQVPTWRVDVAREADLIEEVGRHHGYDTFPTTFPPLREAPPRPDPTIARNHELRAILVGAGFAEAIGYSFIERAAALPFVGWPASPAAAGASLRARDAVGAEADPLVPLAYPLSELFAVLRPSLLPGLLDAVVRNRRRETPDVRLFEIGSCFSAEDGERGRLAVIWCGAGRPAHWAVDDEPVDFFHVKGVVEQVAHALRLPPLSFEPAAAPWLVPGRAAQVTGNGRVMGLLGQILPSLAEAREMPGGDAVYAAELDLEALHAAVPASDVQVEALPRFPSVVRDVSLIVDEGLPSERVRATIRSAAPETLVSVREFDRYQGKGIPEGRCSLSFRLTFRSAERTLTDIEVQDAMDRVIEAVKAAHAAVQR